MGAIETRVTVDRVHVICILIKPSDSLLEQSALFVVNEVCFQITVSNLTHATQIRFLLSIEDILYSGFLAQIR